MVKVASKIKPKVIPRRLKTGLAIQLAQKSANIEFNPIFTMF